MNIKKKKEVSSYKNDLFIMKKIIIKREKERHEEILSTRSSPPSRFFLNLFANTQTGNRIASGFCGIRMTKFLLHGITLEDILFLSIESWIFARFTPVAIMVTHC